MKTRLNKYLLYLFLLLACLLLLSGCSGRPQTDMKNTPWQEWVIGTPLAWSADYYLTKRGDVEHIYRYDYITDCILALESNYVDAIAVDRIYARYVEVHVPETIIVEDLSIGPDKLVAFTARSWPELRDELNEFIADFVDTPECADLHYRANNFVDDEYVINNDIPQHSDGEKLVVAVDAASGFYPYTFFDFVTREPQGLDVEFIKRFAWEYGYTIEWFDADWDACTIALYNENVDVLVGGCSYYFTEDMDLSGYGLYTDPYFDLDLCLLVKKLPELAPNYDLTEPAR